MNSDSVCSIGRQEFGLYTTVQKAIPGIKGAGCKRHPTGAERFLRSSDNCGCSARGGSRVGISVHEVVVFTFPLPWGFWFADLFFDVDFRAVAVYLRTAFVFTSAFANFAIVDGGLYCLLVVLLVVGVMLVCSGF